MYRFEKRHVPTRLNLTEYAKHRGVFPRAVEAAIAAGRIRRDADGLIDAEQADRDWQAHTSSIRSAASKLNGSRGQQIRRALKNAAPASVNPVNEPASAQPEAAKSEATDMGAYAKARAAREHWQSELARLNFEARQKKLLPRDEVTGAARSFYSSFKTALEAIPDRLADELAATGDSAQVRKILTDEIASVMTRQGSVEASYGG